jgi:phage/plasmid-like protein (TIGR03299 family)
MHNLEKRENDGQYSYVGVRTAAWHGLGNTYFDRDGITVEQACDDLQVGEVIGSEGVSGTVLTPLGVATVLDASKKMTIRVRPDGSTVPLGIVGKNYQIMSEREAFAFAANIIDSGEVNLISAGLLDGGRRAFCTLRLPTEVKIGGHDQVDMNVVVAFGHDGSLALTGVATPIRVVCQNTLSMALKQAAVAYKLRHTANARLDVVEARRMLQLTYSYADEWTQAAEQMISTGLTELEFERFIDDLMAPKNLTIASAKSKANWETRRDQVMQLWRGDTNAGITGTVWGAFNTVTEWVDWQLPVKGADDPDLARLERTAQETLAHAGEGMALKQRAFEAAMAWTN